MTIQEFEWEFDGLIWLDSTSAECCFWSFRLFDFTRLLMSVAAEFVIFMTIELTKKLLLGQYFRICWKTFCFLHLTTGWKIPVACIIFNFRVFLKCCRHKHILMLLGYALCFQIQITLTFLEILNMMALLHTLADMCANI